MAGHFWNSPEPDWDAPPEATTATPGEVLAISRSRRHPDPRMVERRLRRYFETLSRNTVIRTGGAIGVDRLAEEIARDLDFPFIETIEPEYHLYEAAKRWQAPLDRNTTIVEGGFAHGRPWEPAARLLAFPATRNESGPGGTWDAVRKARKAGIPVAVIGPDGKKLGAERARR